MGLLGKQKMDCAPAKKLENLTQQGFKDFLHQQFETVCFGHEEPWNMLGYVVCASLHHKTSNLDKFGSSEVWRRCGWENLRILVATLHSYAVESPQTSMV